MSVLKSIAVFCGSSSGYDVRYSEAAKLLGKFFALHGIQLIYGGASVGLMGDIADACLANGGKVIGVLPDFLRSKEIAHKGLTENFITTSMHERKEKMNQLCDGVIALPGGFGTLDELFEMLTWGQLGLHQKPIGLYNIGGFFDPLLQMISDMEKAGFLKKVNADMLLVDEDLNSLLQKMENYVPPATGKWIVSK